MTFNDRIIAYLKDIKVTDVVDRRISMLALKYESVFPEPIEDIFIEYYKTKEESIAYPSVQFYSKNYNYQIENFLTNEKLEIYPMVSMDFVSFSPENFDFKTPNAESKLVVVFSNAFIVQCQLVAIGNNCKYLLLIYNQYLKPRFITNKVFDGE